MVDDIYMIKAGRKLRCGYTTGTCAAGAAKAAAIMLHTGKVPDTVEIETPAGRIFSLCIEKPALKSDKAACCVVKDAGDDPDVTNGMEIFAEVRKRQDGKIVIDGGKGIGRITREGFSGKVGEAAINPVPRRMIREALHSVSGDGWNVLIYAPQGEEIARKTFNSNLGIEGGISILGTTGIVEPMSDEALKKTIYLQINAVRQTGSQKIILYLGNYGKRVIDEHAFDAPKVKVSNFIGDALLYCYNTGFRSVTLIGHIGKLCKLSLGAFNTHNKVCDVRIEAFVYYLALAGAPRSLIQQVNQCTTSEEVLKLLFAEGCEHIVNDMREGCISRIKRYVKDQNFDVEVILYSMEYGIL